MPKQNITYLLGAGASWHSLPLINEFVQIKNPQDQRYSFSLDFFIKSFNDVVANHHDPRFELLLNRLRESTYDVYNGLISGKHSTIDTWAKKTLIQNDIVTMEKIRNVTNLYLSSLEYLNGNDPRYETFFSNLLAENPKELPINLKILSWNYDRQVQSAILRVVKNKELYKFNSEVYPEFDIRDFINSRNHLKINGELSGFSKNAGYLQVLYDSAKFDSLQKIIPAIIGDQFSINPDFISDDIQYAWNEERIFHKFDNSKAFFECDKLVVIGYSFPDSNRKIDVNIFERMKGSLKKIIIQDKYPEVVLDKVKDVMEGAGMEFREDFVRLIKNCDNFYIPNDLLY